MPDIPYPITAETLEEMRSQVGELIRQLWKDGIGGAQVGDVFSINTDVLELRLKTDGGLEKESNELKVKAAGTGYTITNKTADRTLDCDGGDINVVSDVLGTLIDDLKSQGYLE